MKKTIAGIILALVITAARAEEPKVSVAPVSPSEYTLKVTPQEVITIGKGLGSQPFNEVQPLMAKLNQQILDQNTAAQPKPKK